MLNARSPLYKTLVGAKLEVFFYFKVLRTGQLSWITQRSELCNSVSQFLQNCFTPFSSSQSGKANCESAFGVKSCTKTYPKGHPPLYGSAFQALPTRGATTPLIVTAVLNSTRAADFRTGKVPGSEKPEPASPKGDRRSVLSEKEIQDSDNCSRLHMGCPYCFHS